MRWGENGEGGEGGEPPEDDEGPEEPELDEEDEGPEEPELDEEDEGPEEPELDEEDEGPEGPEVDEDDEGPEEPELDEEDEGPEEPELDEDDEGPEEPELDEDDEGPEEPELEEDEGPEEPEVDESDEGPEEPELEEGDEGPEEPELEEGDEERDKELEFLDKVEGGGREREDVEGWSQEHSDEGDVAERFDGERSERFSEDPEKKEEGKEDGEQELPEVREKTGDRSSEPKREGDANQEDFKEVSSPDAQFTTSREWGERKTPDGGWEQYRIDSTVVQNEKTQTSVEKTSVFSRGETPEGDKIVGFAEGLETQTRVRIDSNRFDDLFVKVRSIEQVHGVETHRPVDLSLMKLLEGEPVKEGIRIHSDPELKDVRMVGKTTEIWRDADGLPHVRTARWMLLQPEKGETRGEKPSADGDKTRLFGYVKINEIRLSKGKIDRKETFTWFSPVSGKSGEGLKDEGETSKAEGEAKTGEPPQGLKLLFGYREGDAARYDYRVKHEVAEVVYLPTETDTEDKTTGTSSVIENVEKTNDKTAENAEESFEKTKASSEVKTSEGIAKGTVVETSEETAEKAIEGLAEKTVERVDEKTAETLGESVEKTDEAIGEFKTSEGPVEKSVENPSEETAEGVGESVLVERGDGEQASPDDVLRMVVEGVFRAGGEEEYYEELRERGVQLDVEKLEKMLFVERRIPEEVYLALESLWREGEGGKSGGEEAPRLEADTEPVAGGVPASSKEEEELEDNLEETEREPQAQEQPEEGEQELGLENLFIIVLNMLRGVTYSLSKNAFLDLFEEAMRKAGSEEKFAELLRRKKAGQVNVELLYDVLKHNEVPLELLGAVLNLVEKTQNVESRVQEMVKKTLELVRRMGGDLLRDRGIDGQGSVTVDEERGGAGSAEELRRKGYAFLGQLLGKYMNKEGLLDDWIFDIIMMCEREAASLGGKKKLEDSIEKRLREVWASLGMDAKFKLSTIIDEVYYRLERRDLLVFLYDGRLDPRGRRGRVASFVDVLEILVEAVKKAGSEENFLEVVRRKTGRLFYQHLVDEQLAWHRLDEEILRVAIEYVYGARDRIDRRLELLERNTDYILTRLMEETLFLSQLERLLEPLAELNSRLGRFGQAAAMEEYTKKEGESPKEKEKRKIYTSPVHVSDRTNGMQHQKIETSKESALANAAPPGETEMGEGSGAALMLVVQSLMKSLGLEEKLRHIYSEEEEGSKETKEEKEWLRFLVPLFGKRNLRYVLELVSYGLLRGIRESENAVTMGEALDEVVEYSRILSEKAGEILLNENIGRLIDEEARWILEEAIEKFTLEALMEEYDEAVLEQVVKMQLLESEAKSDEKIEPLIKAIRAVKQPVENIPPDPLSDTPSYRTNALTRLAEEIGTTVSDLRNYIDVPYCERKRMTKYVYYKIYDVLGLPPRNKRVCRVDFLRALLKVMEKMKGDSTAPETYLNKDNLQKMLTEELRYYEFFEKEAYRIYSLGDEAKNERLRHIKYVVDLNDIKYTLELFATGLRDLLAPITSCKETEKIIEAVGETVKKYELRLERTLGILLNKKGSLRGPRIEKLSDNEVQYILNAAINWKKQQLGIPLTEDAKIDKTTEQGFLTQLAKEINIPFEALRHFIQLNYDYRNRMTRETYLKICDVLNLPPAIREGKQVSREDLLLALLMAIGEQEDERETRLEIHSEIGASTEEAEELLTLPWFEQPPGIYCIFFKEDLLRVWQKALERWGSKAEISRRMREIGVETANEDTLYGFRTNTKVDVELVLGLIGVVIDRKLGEVRKLAREGELAQVFMSSLKDHNLIDENDLEWLSGLSREVVREVSLESLAKGILREMTTQEKMITAKEAQSLLKHLVIQGLLDEEFSVNLPKEVWHELRDIIKKMKISEERILTPEELKSLRKERGLRKGELAEKAGVSSQIILDIERGLKIPKLSIQVKILNALKEKNEEKIELKLKEENLFTYASRKIKENTGEDIPSKNIKNALLTKEHRINMKNYLAACETFGVKPNLSLHYRENRSRAHLSRIRSLRSRISEIDFTTPMVYKNPSGTMTVEIRESEKDIFIIINGKCLKAEKRKTRYGGEWWGLTVIEYETEEGIYTIVPETGELWPPLVMPWYTAPRNWDIGFKTSQTLKKLFLKIREALPQLKLVDLSKITGIGYMNLLKMSKGKKKTATLGQLLTLIALKSTLTQTNIKSEIQKIEQEIETIEGIKLPEQRENILYINLKTPEGAALIGHALGDANLNHRGHAVYIYDYVSMEYSDAEDVSKLLKYYGAECKVNKEERSVLDGIKRKTLYRVASTSLLGYALYSSTQSFREKNQEKPKSSKRNNKGSQARIPPRPGHD